MKKVLVIIILVSFSIGVNAASTNTQKIARVQFEANDGNLYFVGGEKWSSPGCENATYIWVRPQLEGVQEMLSIGLAAYLSGKSVTFWGDCHSDPDYFVATYIIFRDS